jgi:DNA-binding MarR family transcriptional regulator
MSAASGTIFLLKRAELAVRGCVEEALLQFGLTPTQFHVLLLLERSPGISAAQIARSVGIRPQSVNDTLGPVERKGLLLRKPSATHRRVLENRLSAAGARLLARSLPVVSHLEDELLSAIPEAALKALQDSLERLRASAEAGS